MGTLNRNALRVFGEWLKVEYFLAEPAGYDLTKAFLDLDADGLAAKSFGGRQRGSSAGEWIKNGLPVVASGNEGFEQFQGLLGEVLFLGDLDAIAEKPRAGDSLGVCPAFYRAVRGRNDVLTLRPKTNPSLAAPAPSCPME